VSTTPSPSLSTPALLDELDLIEELDLLEIALVAFELGIFELVILDVFPDPMQGRLPHIHTLRSDAEFLQSVALGKVIRHCAVESHWSIGGLTVTLLAELLGKTEDSVKEDRLDLFGIEETGSLETDAEEREEEDDELVVSGPPAPQAPSPISNINSTKWLNLNSFSKKLNFLFIVHARNLVSKWKNLFIQGKNNPRRCRLKLTSTIYAWRTVTGINK
jgi:hypothetical protein